MDGGAWSAAIHGVASVGHDWATSLSLFTLMHWRRKWQPIPVFLPGESQGRGSLVGCRLWGHTESDTTEATEQQQQQQTNILQSRNRDADVENKHTNTMGEMGSRMNWEIGIDIYTLLILCIKQITFYIFHAFFSLYKHRIQISYQYPQIIFWTAK